MFTFSVTVTFTQFISEGAFVAEIMKCDQGLGSCPAFDDVVRGFE
jgi:hypothetical protein